MQMELYYFLLFSTWDWAVLSVILRFFTEKNECVPRYMIFFFHFFTINALIIFFIVGKQVNDTIMTIMCGNDELSSAMC
jgi:hypothetical protein